METAVTGPDTSSLQHHDRETVEQEQAEERFELAEESPQQEETVRDRWADVDVGDTLLGGPVHLELKGVKTTMILAPEYPIPAEAEGLLVEHFERPLSSQMEVILTVDDRIVVRESFFLPTHQRRRAMEAHRQLVEMNSEVLTNAHLRDAAMSVYFPELVEEYDVWYRVHVNEDGLMRYAVHVGPSHFQDIKKEIEGELQL